VLVGAGVDPMETKIATRTAPTLAELAERFMREHVAAKRKSSTARLYRGLLDNIILPALGQRAVNAITRGDVAALHHRHRATPTHANRMVMLISNLMNHAERLGLRPDGSNPARHVERFRERPRQRFLSAEEFQRLGQALDASDASVYVKAAVALLAFTGCRRGEILALTWPDVDLERGVLRLRDTKTGPRTVYLNPAAMRVLEGLPREQGNPAVIVGRAGARKTIKRAWHHIREAAGLTDVRLHDLRHSYASVGAGGGLSLPAIGALLGHSQPATTQRYAHLIGDPLREATALIGATIEQAMNGNSQKNIDEEKRHAIK
jgi:integrase